MSKVCIGISKNILPMELSHWRDQIQEIVSASGYGVYFSLDYQEPFVENYTENILLFSIADTNQYDNCEMFLLPDGGLFNGRKNSLLFRERMQVMLDIAVLLSNNCHPIEFFIGHSGEPYEEYTIYDVTLDKLIDTLELLNSHSSELMNIHIYISAEKTE